ncbi:TonB-dependent siderophore receptor [Phenylobacterium sp.]|uniref:TonB-dependent receptor plug domain-containing protein n=1 Tax=Phenylobacterium sp. TaxID=1871053 RepID=UPI00272F4C42|nr:TonB-dependent receptor [Phenylobacterium sp.]MDP2213719.1 TonB-dependent receptor [Phenylobacterium sp.]
MTYPSSSLATPSRRLRRYALATASAAALLTQTAPALAQSAASSAELQEVVVTGSRIVRDGYDAPTPVNVLGSAEILAEAPANIADFVNTLPSVAGSVTASSSSGSLSNGQAGISALNLRALGTGRTLVLFDGQRSVVSAATGQVDTNTFPQSLISRVEVVTGGASSAYGSDAIGGVVNFILDKAYTGLKMTAEYGETTYGDGENWKYNFTAGAPFADGKGHILLSAETVSQAGIHGVSRDWNKTGHFAIRNPNTAADQPFYVVADNVGISSYAPGGLITAGPLRGTYFGVNGSVNQLAYGQVSGQWMIGGDWEYTSSLNGTNSLLPDEDRDSFFGRVSYEVAPNINVFAQASYARYEGLSYYIQPTNTGITIRSDNAFLPASVRSQMTTLGLTSFVMGSGNADLPWSGSNNIRETSRYVVGADGDFSLFGRDFGWDAYYQHGVTKTREELTPTWNNARLALATDAVVHPTTGQIVCRSTLTSPSNGCVPLNRFGIGVASQAAIDYVLGQPLRTQEFVQDVAAVNFTTDFTGWAGPIDIAFGAEWRNETLDGEVDAASESGWKYGNYKVTTGEYDVVEGYIETLVPIMEGLDFNGAARYTRYSTSGGVTTWKAGLTYTPIPDITLRATASRDIRAANMSELFDAGTARSNSVSINGVSTAFVQNLQGNVDVQPEVADGLGVGVVFQPSFLPGFAASIDYYEIKVDGVISFVTAQQAADYCFLNNVQRYCNNLRYQNGQLAFIDLYYENLNSLSAKGLDIEASYRTSLDAFIPGAAGNLTLRAMATHYMENITDDGVTAIDLAGSNISATPNWVYRITAAYNLDPISLNLTARGVSDGVISNAYTECTSACPTLSAPYYTINDNSIEGALYFDASATYAFDLGQSGASGEAYISIKNLFNNDPPLTANPNALGAENTVGYLQTNRSLYDTLGRTFRVGLRLAF